MSITPSKENQSKARVLPQPKGYTGSFLQANWGGDKPAMVGKVRRNDADDGTVFDGIVFDKKIGPFKKLPRRVQEETSDFEFRFDE